MGTADRGTQRCWRCLQMIECDVSDIPPGPPQWWLCPPCRHSLTPGVEAHRR